MHVNFQRQGCSRAHISCLSIPLPPPGSFCGSVAAQMAAASGGGPETLKAAVREGVPPQLRRQLWLTLSGVHHDETKEYMHACSRVFGTADALPDKLFSVRVDFRSCSQATQALTMAPTGSLPRS